MWTTAASPPGECTLRREGPDDLEFLVALYTESRWGELGAVPWSDTAKRAFLRQQFEAQKTHYDRHYADAERSIVEVEGRPAGRLYVAFGAAEVCIVDILLAASARGRGIGTALLGALVARAASRPVRIHVERENPARRLYERLGFECRAEEGVYLLMVRPGSPG